jgi:hypothetical protein
VNAERLTVPQFAAMAVDPGRSPVACDGPSTKLRARIINSPLKRVSLD